MDTHGLTVALINLSFFLEVLKSILIVLGIFCCLKYLKM